MPDMAKRREKQRIEKPLPIDLGDGDTLNIMYRPGVFTVEDAFNMRQLTQDATQAKATGGKELDADVTYSLLMAATNRLLDSVTQWDLTDNGEPVPLTMEGLRTHQVDFDLINFVNEAIQNDQSPNPPIGRDSETG